MRVWELPPSTQPKRVNAIGDDRLCARGCAGRRILCSGLPAASFQRSASSAVGSCFVTRTEDGAEICVEYLPLLFLRAQASSVTLCFARID